MNPVEFADYIVKKTNEYNGQAARIIEATLFPTLISSAFSEIEPGYKCHALLYNITMETVLGSGGWAYFREVWLDTYCDKNVESVAILLPIHPNSQAPCEWTSVNGLAKMVSEYGEIRRDYLNDIDKLRQLCEITSFAMVPIQHAKEVIAATYAFAMYIVLPEHKNIYDLLEMANGKDHVERDTAILEISKGVRLILGATIDSPYTVFNGNGDGSSYKFLILIPQRKPVDKDNVCIIKEHTILFSKLWKKRTGFNCSPSDLSERARSKLSFLNNPIYQLPSCERTVPLDYAFLMYHLFFCLSSYIQFINDKHAKAKVWKTANKFVTKNKLEQAYIFARDIRSGLAFLDDRTVCNTIKKLIENPVISARNMKRIGEFILYDDTEWNKFNLFIEDIKDKIRKQINNMEVSPKEIGYHIWAPPSSGKTFFLGQLYDLLNDEFDDKMEFVELSLSGASKDQITTWIDDVRRHAKDKVVIAFVDEIDKEASYEQPIKLFFDITSIVKKEGGKLVFVVAGSKPTSIESMELYLQNPNIGGGSDLLQRVKTPFSFPEYSFMDRLYMCIDAISVHSEGRIKQVELLPLLVRSTNPVSTVSDNREFIKGLLKKTFDDSSWGAGEEVILGAEILHNPKKEYYSFSQRFPETHKLAKDAIIHISD